jgi:hypothetical protein
LQAGSPAINAGRDCTATDQRGTARVGICDIGAFEFVPIYCGTSTFTASSGLISDGSGTNNYLDNQNCTWLIQPAGIGTIRLNFTSFTTESVNDFVEIYNGTSATAPLLGRYSGTALPPTINATGNVMFIRFVSNGSINSQGWTANYTLVALPAVHCGTSTFTTNSGTLHDGSNGDNYLNNQTCTWLVQPAGAGTIRFNFTFFGLENGNDFVEVYDGANASAPLLGRYTGTTMPPVINTTGNRMFIRFTTNGSITAQGWAGNYTLIPPVYCGTSTFTASSGSISDGSGTNNYLDNQNCTWLIQPAGIGTIRLNFTSFTTESVNDFIEIYNGTSATAPLLGRYSGTALPPIINATGNVMFIRFVSNGSINSQGWEASYTLIPPVYCGTSTFTASSGSISDGSGTNNYLDNQNCTWLIQPAGIGTIRLNFTSFTTESVNDFVEIYNGTSATAPLLGRYSGTALPPTINATGNVMFIRFVSNGSINSQGWTANYTLVALPAVHCGTSTFTTNSGTLHDGSNGDNYLNNQTCTWLVQPAGAGTIRFNFTFFGLENGNDFVEVYDGANASAPLLGRYTGTTMPPVINTTGNRMFIRFTTNGSITAQGWAGNYTFIASSGRVSNEETLPNESSVNVYPNPVTEQLKVQVQSDYLGKLQIQLYNTLGVTLWQNEEEKINTVHKMSIDMDNYASGAYFVRIIQGGNQAIKKIVK